MSRAEQKDAMRRAPDRTRRWWSAGIAVAVVAACLPLASAAGHAAGAGGPDDQRRSIVFILTDDPRFDALGLLNDYFRTPNLDRLAEAGVLFENAFVTTSLCSPSRASRCATKGCSIRRCSSSRPTTASSSASTA